MSMTIARILELSDGFYRLEVRKSDGNLVIIPIRKRDAETLIIYRNNPEEKHFNIGGAAIYEFEDFNPKHGIRFTEDNLRFAFNKMKWEPTSELITALIMTLKTL